ncbi:MAG TPA: DUF423 domain-containing protein [Chitinophagaceae bacterium]|nr:DUF423 domain-containing protein [Chitinophagaceae bacterium]
MRKSFLIQAAVLGALAVMAGAFGAHGLKSILSAEELSVFETAVRYQMLHVFALLAAGILYREFPGRWMVFSGRCFFYGILLFSGSLYLITGLELNAVSIPLLVGLSTPLGGLLLIAGWILLAIALGRSGAGSNR